MCGTSEERRRARDYLDWLIAQRTGPVSVEVLDRDDVTVMEVRCSSCSLSLCAHFSVSSHTHSHFFPQLSSRPVCSPVCCIFASSISSAPCLQLF